MGVEISPMLIRARPDGGYELDLASITVDAWQPVTYLNGWDGSVQYYRDPFGIVRLRGTLGGGAHGGFNYDAGPAIALPAPGVYGNWVVAGSDDYSFVTLTDTGVLFAIDSLPPFYGLDMAPITYKV